MNNRQPKTRQFHMRLTSDQYEALSASARSAGLNMTDYVLACVERRAVFLAVDRELVASVRHELARQGNNLNQIAWRLNSLSRSNALACADAIADVQNSQAARVAAYRAAQSALALEGRRTCRS